MCLTVCLFHLLLLKEQSGGNCLTTACGKFSEKETGGGNVPKAEKGCRSVKGAFAAAAQRLCEQPGIEMFSNSRAVVDGCRAVVEYDCDIIRLNLGNKDIIFRGRELSIDSFEKNHAEVSGIFTSLEFE